MSGAIDFHRELAVGWEHRYQTPAFRGRVDALERCLAGLDLRGRKWLDAGCGSGTLSRLLSNEGCDVLGVDAAEEMVAMAHRLSSEAESPGRLRFECIRTIAQLPLPDESIDGVLCSSVLEYVSDPSECLQEFARVLRPGGVLVVSVPNRHSLIRKLRSRAYSVGKLLRQRWFELVAYSRNDYSVASFNDLLRSTGFVAQQVISFDNPFIHFDRLKPFGGTLLFFRAVRE
jgi:2-polyprenyl-3-methyl-5-hydroxy-6-metoxy-1,4-benzoquinol methylase